MRQLTSLDAQFLALETPRQSGHVAGLAILDPTSAPGGTLAAWYPITGSIRWERNRRA